MTLRRTPPAAQFTNVSDLAGDGTYLYATANHAVRRVEIANADVTTWTGSSGTNDLLDTYEVRDEIDLNDFRVLQIGQLWDDNH